MPISEAIEMDPQQVAELLDWKRRVFDLYREVRAGGGSREAWQRWKDVRDDLFRSHPSSPLALGDREGFTGLRYFEHDPEARAVAELEPTSPERYEIATSGDESYSFTRFARARFTIFGTEASLELYWLDGYGGGVFLPFRDATAGSETYGAGRYLLDTVKGADLGGRDGRMVLDFNFAYNPSCAYDPRWVCPLAPPANRIDIAIRAGELNWASADGSAS